MNSRKYRIRYHRWDDSPLQKAYRNTLAGAMDYAKNKSYAEIDIRTGPGNGEQELIATWRNGDWAIAKYDERKSVREANLRIQELQNQIFEAWQLTEEIRKLISDSA